MQARVRRSETAASGLEFHVFKPTALAKHLENQCKKPSHLRDLCFLDQGHRSIAEYCPGLGVGLGALGQSDQIFIADCPDPQDQKNCTALNAYKDLEELLSSDRPIATIQITRFKDSTLVTISASHIIGDVFTIKTMLQTWEKALHRKQISPMQELGRDPFTAYGPGGQLATSALDQSADLPPSLLPAPPPGWQLYGLLEKACLIIRLLWDRYISRPRQTISSKYLFISDAEMQAMEEEANQDMIKIQEQRQKQESDDQMKLSVSRFNISFAWIMKHCHSQHHSEDWTTPVAVVNARGKPPTGMRTGSNDFPKNEWYNGALNVPLPSLNIGDLKTMPLGELALHVREGVNARTTPENIRRSLAFALHHNLWTKPSGQFVFWGPPNHRWSIISDWRSAKLQEIDFTPALLDYDEYEVNRKVLVSGINSCLGAASDLRDAWVGLGHYSGGFWFQGFLSNSEWRYSQGFGKFRHLERG